MGSLSFGISELLLEPASGWFKLLNAEEGEYYNINIPPEYEEEMEKIRRKMEAVKEFGSVSRTLTDSSRLSSASQSQLIKESDFTFLSVLGKGSFGKVEWIFFLTANKCTPVQCRQM
ncbi:hypothetical protein OESDEN_04058 [Oesophagostomum dentatum]|uniref:Protein kinase domain-containing protein n=1 Tax=Oesophagostomum dentatum TaxID=61180 RepID=A0A0B1TFF0_OESDE|nr:hypothetical protein OESDEN_04058 [Oesophagostomum dentatum]